MAHGLFQLSSGLYTGVAVLLLLAWTLTALAFTALNVLNSNSSYLEIIASSSLLTFLFCRLLVASSESSPSTRQDDTIARLVASADHGSRRGAVVLFGLCCTWLYELLNQAVLLFFMTVFGSVMATAIYNDAFTDDVVDVDESTTALSVEMDKFEEMAGFNPTQMFKLIPPRLLVYFVALVWLNFLSLGAYVLGHAAVSLKKLLSSSVTVGRAGTAGEKEVAAKQ
ncbi:hypothetical protein ANOM_008041 [Aspergillus nomiae NRRL 13137]|uniref:Uncharacterized protein n=1 Tax=Aspergillus nomiae NRRL (strain ATCC 15546 / NRRL 13137 / CBS 260.88 / M93) TaxID=1509407 RepID=A0A0L1IVE3_ASPN3|nr:uncharacterized protein ANOM_008041 [Aspergillus nomiae NRRL 13137]KNG83447.1 hypothetical protein ANOM_008041 [Aspergillus nomiae NRRL 13137]